MLNILSEQDENESGFTDVLYDIVGFTSNEFHLKEPKLAVDGIQLIDNCLDSFVFLSCSQKPASKQ